MTGAEELSRYVRDVESQALADLNLLDRVAPASNSEKGVRDKRDSRDTLRRKGLGPFGPSGQRGDNRDNGELRAHFELLERDGIAREAGVYWVDVARDGGGEVTGYAPPRWICSPLRVAADICTPSYESACRAVDALVKFSKDSGVPINFKKSAGIHLLAPKLHSTEIRSKPSFDFLGYAISNEHLSIKSASVLKMKKEISFLLYKNLIQPLRGATLRALLIPSGGRDEALLTAMMQIRRYLCGGAYKDQLRSFAEGNGGQLKFKGAMSFYPLVTDVAQLKQLDGWLVATIWRAMKLRASLLAKHGYTRHMIFPFSVPQNRLVRAFDTARVHGKPLLQIPSFHLVQRAMQRGMREHGISYVMNSRSNSYTY